MRRLWRRLRRFWERLWTPPPPCPPARPRRRRMDYERVEAIERLYADARWPQEQERPPP